MDILLVFLDIKILVEIDNLIVTENRDDINIFLPMDSSELGETQLKRGEKKKQKLEKYFCPSPYSLLPLLCLLPFAFAIVTSKGIVKSKGRRGMGR